MTTRTSPGIAWESLSAAAARTGFGVDFLRDKIADGTLRAYRVTNKPGAAIRLKVADVDAMFVPVVPDEVR